MKCPCQSGQEFSSCCEPITKGAVVAETAEQLMRARYTAYTMGNLKFIQDTLAAEAKKDFDMAEAKKWAEKSKWMGLQIIETQDGKAGDSKGVVEFIAKYSAGGQVIEHHEVAQFRKEKDKWVFVDGDAHTHKEGAYLIFYLFSLSSLYCDCRRNCKGQ